MPPNALDNITIVLVGTKHAGNIGSAARAMRNMGLSRLRLAASGCTINEDSYRLAKSGRVVLEQARTCISLQSALRGIRLVIGTTGKTGGSRQEACPPRTLAPELIVQARTQQVGIVFGPEDTGLTDQHLLRCHRLVRIPTAPSARSVNLAQAVMLVCYELRLASLVRAPGRVPALAPLEQIEAMYGQLEHSLLRIGFMNPKTARHMMLSLRRLFGRTGLEERDVAILRGIARQIGWFAGRSG